MKRALTQGLLAVLGCEFIMNALLLLSGGPTEYLAGYSEYTQDDWIGHALIMFGAFVAGLVNNALGMSRRELAIGLLLVPMILALWLFAAIIFGIGYSRRWILILLPLSTTLAIALPSVLTWIKQQLTQRKPKAD